MQTMLRCLRSYPQYNLNTSNLKQEKMLLPASLTTLSVIALLIFLSSPTAKASIVYRPASAGWSTTYYSLNRAMIVNNSAQVTESLTYQASTGRVVVSNLFPTSYTTSLAMSTGINDQSISYSGKTLPSEALSNSTFGTFGLLTDLNSDNIIWAAIGLFPPTPTSACAAASIDTTLNKYTNVYDFSSFKNKTTGCLVDDVYVTTANGASNMLYATDFFGYAIYKANLMTGVTSSLNHDQSLLCAGYSNPNGCLGDTTNGPNGIVMYTDSNGNDWLLISVTPNRLVKMDPVSGNGTVVNPGPNTAANALQYLDGMTLYFAGINSVLYAASGTAPTGALQVLTSTDDWTTFELRQVLNMNCNDQSATGIRQAGNSYLIGLCNNNFNPGKSLVNVVPDFVSMQPIAYSVQTVNFTNLVPESFSYDPNKNMVIFGSQMKGGLTGFPYNNMDGTVINYEVSDAYTYVASGTTGMTATAGVQVNPNNGLGSNCYALICDGYFFDPTTSGLSLVDLCQDQVISTISLPRTTTMPGSMANDVTILNGKAYVTDFTGYQVWSVDVSIDSAGVPSLSNAQVVLTANSCTSNNPALCVTYPDGIVPINSDGGYLIISLFTTGMVKYVPSTGALTMVYDPTGLVNQFDGMAISSDNNIVYGVRGSFSELYQSVYAFTSCSNWENVTLLATFQSVCGGSNPTANQLITNTDGSQDLIILCNDGFGPGPYSVSRIRNINAIVTNQALSVNSCASSIPSSNGNSYDAGKNVGGAIGVLFAVFTFYCFAAWLMNKKAFMALLTCSPRPTKNDGNTFDRDRDDSKASSVSEMSKLPSTSRH